MDQLAASQVIVVLVAIQIIASVVAATTGRLGFLNLCTALLGSVAFLAAVYPLVGAGGQSIVVQIAGGLVAFILFTTGRVAIARYKGREKD